MHSMKISVLQNKAKFWQSHLVLGPFDESTPPLGCRSWIGNDKMRHTFIAAYVAKSFGSILERCSTTPKTAMSLPLLTYLQIL
ncbi:hypothetical protein TNCV_1225371 [Trichonephila clavipes]|nr:hypothetical protein TNCV_1225371 [Trichonephila clavipes]